eukprot:6474350-Amphidinium_carterae.1
MKNALYQAERIRKGLDDASGEHASLTAAMKTVQSAEILVNLKALSVAERTKKLDEVVGANGGEVLPPKFRALLLTQVVRETSSSLTVAEVASWQSMVTPTGGQSKILFINKLECFGVQGYSSYAAMAGTSLLGSDSSKTFVYLWIL